MREQVALKAPVAAAVAEVTAFAHLAEAEPDGVVADADRRDHLAGAGLRQHAVGFPLQRVLQLDREPREIARRRPESGRFELRVDVPLRVHRRAPAAVRARGDRDPAPADSGWSKPLLRMPIGSSTSAFISSGNARPVVSVTASWTTRDAAAGVLERGERRPLHQDLPGVRRLLAVEDLHDRRNRIFRVVAGETEPVAESRTCG